MTSSSDAFPFGIADVVELLGLTVRRTLPSSLYLNCPFCGDQRGRLNVDTDKNVWRCNRCGVAGGMLALYARYNCTSNADAYREICEALGCYTPRPRVNDCIGVKPEQNIRATPQEIHQTYSLLLSMLPLTPTHKAHLLSPRRGLTEEQIARFGFKSTPPAFLCRSYAERLLRQGCTLQGVPGFYMDNAGRWTINFGSRTAGILLPAVGMDGLICGMQIRLDTPLRRRDDPPGKSGAKYIWLSSIGKPHGVTSGSPLHFVGEPFAKTVYVTEGLLKADIAHCLTGRSFVAVAGVNSLNGLESALHCMAQNGTKLVVEAYDMDKLENEYSQLPDYMQLKRAFLYRSPMEEAISTYSDYLQMCQGQNYDMKSSQVLFPKHCNEAHDELSRYIKKCRDEQTKRAFREVYENLAEKANLSSKKLQIVCPKQTDDLIAEGQALHHCVGTYIERVAAKKCLIVFVRRVEELEKPFVTVEVSGGKIVQIRGERNSEPTKEVKKFVDLWSRKVLPMALRTA